MSSKLEQELPYEIRSMIFELVFCGISDVEMEEFSSFDYTTHNLLLAADGNTQLYEEVTKAFLETAVFDFRALIRSKKSISLFPKIHHMNLSLLE